ncbi:MAG: uroporphyrinogen-III C-methyltransferase [Gammaproteobacteria bacterium]
MSEEQQKPEAPTEVPSAATAVVPPVVPSGAPVVAPRAPRPLAQPLAIAALVIALVIALGTAVGGYFVWHEVQRQGAWQQQVLGQIDARSQTLDQRLQGFKDRLDDDLAASERSRRELEAQQARLVAAQAGLEDALALLRAQVGRSQHDWVLAEAQYLMIVASQRVQLQRDVATAIAALQAADQRLQSLADPGLTPVREQLAQELAALRAVALPDLAGIALTLDSLAGDLAGLPLRETRVAVPAGLTSPDAQVVEAPAADDWTRLPRQLWDALRRLVVVRYNDAPVGPLLAPEQQFFLHENLRLHLGTARLAALLGDSASYRASLNTAAAWLGAHFAEDAPRVVAARAELTRLAGLELRPALPDLSASLRLLRERARLAELGGPPAADGVTP